MEEHSSITANFQRIGSESNSQVGMDFETAVNDFLTKQGLSLTKHYQVPIGIAEKKKMHMFDFGSNNPKVIVECKSHRWTTGDNTPSAKMTTWNEAMYLFAIAPQEYRKIFVVLKDFNERRRQTLAEYYIKTYEHLIPVDVKILEFDTNANNGIQLK